MILGPLRLVFFIMTQQMRLPARFAYILIMCVSCLPAFSGEPGTTAYQFLNIPSSSHVYGLGGYNISVIDDDINLVEHNPALLGPEFDHQAGLGYMRYVGGTNFFGARYGQGLREHNAFAAGVQYFGYGEMTATDPDGTVTGKFNARDIAISGSYSHDIAKNLRGGITVKFIHSSYESYSAAAIAADLGINYYDPEKEFSVSLVAKNLGGQIKKFGDNKDKVPWDLQIGASKTFSGLPVRLSLTFHDLNKWKMPYYEPEDKNNSNSALVEKNSFGTNLLRHIVIGAEYLFSDNMYIALGYNYKTRSDMATYHRNLLSGLSVAAGLKVKAFGVGVAYAQPHSSASTFMVNLTTSIGELLR